MRALEQIQDTLQTWPESFADRFKRKLSKEEFTNFLEEVLIQQELKNLREQFSTWAPSEIIFLIDEVKKSKSEFFLDNLKKVK